MPNIRLMWVKPPRGIEGYQYAAGESVIDAGELEPGLTDSSFPGPTGVFKLMPEEFWRLIDLEDPAPVFLHESFTVHIEKWVESVPSASQEVAVIGKVRDAVMQMVDQRLAAQPAAFSLTSTVTMPEQTSYGPVIVGRCLILQPFAA